jgi:GWxTD domain-containing protein
MGLSMQRLPVVYAAALAFGLVVPLAAQAPPDRAAIERLRDSLAGITDSVDLTRLEAATIEVAKRDRDDPLIHLRLGFIAYRLGELSGKSHYDDAAGEFEWAAELRPDWPYPWYGSGLAELAVGEHSIIAIENIRQTLRKDYLSKAARAFAKAAEADPSFADATVDLARTALAQRIAPRLDLALRAVREAAASPAGTSPAVQLARGRVERVAGDADSALSAFHTYLAVGGDSGIGLLEEARTLYFAHQPAAGLRRYFAGAAAARSPAAAAAYRADLAWIASPEDLVAYDRLDGAPARAHWLGDFWQRRDVAEAHAPGERLAEHYRRYFYAERNFRLLSRHRAYDITEVFRSDQSEFDDRGVIYLRHGPPDRRATFIEPDSVEPNETWLYHRPAGDMIFHFVARRTGQDYKLVESLADALDQGFGAALALQGRRIGLTTAGLFGSRADFNPVYARIGVGSGTATLGGMLAQERALGQRSIAVGTTTDSYHQTFEMPLDVIASPFVVGDSGAPSLHVVFAIPAQRLVPIPDSSRVVYPLTFRLYVTDRRGLLAASLDTTRVFASSTPLPGGSYLTGQLSVTVPPGAYGFRLLAERTDGVAGDVVSGDSIVADTLTGERFAVSDLVLGRAGSGLQWTNGADTVFLNPLERFPEGGSVELYYEVYGLPVGAAYHTVIHLEGQNHRSLLGRMFGGGRRSPVLLEFDAPSDGPVTRVHRRLELGDVPRGTYVLGLRVTDPASGVTRNRARQITVVAR